MDRQDARLGAGRPRAAQEPGAGAGADPASGEPSGPGRPERPSPPGLPRRGLRFLRSRGRFVVRLVLWSVLEAAQTFLTGYALARALDDGFLAGRPGTGLAWLGAAAGAVAVGAYGTGRVYGCVAGLVEPLRDRLVREVVARGVREADGGALSGLTQQVEIARDTFAGLVMVSRSFLFTAAGALAGLVSLAPPLLLVVAPPLVAGVALFLATLRPLARRQETFLVADEALAARLGDVCPGLRDITAAGAEDTVAADTGRRVDAEHRAARSLARWGVVRVAALAIGGHLPVVLLLACTPWLLGRGVTAGALIGALAYVTQSLLPALQNLVHGLGTSGSRLVVVLRRLLPPSSAAHPSHLPRRPEPPAHTAPRPGPSTPRAPRGAAALRLSGVTFAYGPDAAPVLDDLSLRLPHGTRLAVVGPSGAGKSTLAGLAAGLLRPRYGTVRLCGERAAGATARAHRVLIPQEAYVFGGSLAENLGELRPKPVPEEELWEAAEAVGLTEVMVRLGGPAAEVDPRALSAGERQLVALGRAYLSYAPVVILDEATCHLDAEAEERAERAFARRPGTTLVVVAHRVSSARRADRVLVMDGRSAAYGEHGDLLARSPLYRDLVGAWSAVPAPPGPRGGGASEPALSLRDPDGVDPVARPRLAGDGGHVVAHGPVGQVQAAGDLGDGGPLRGQG
ncbi:ATP-binding cassette domain-containing protein [Streptomyces scabiei]|uniref:Multidrug resistance ABC transporter ATP-binding/permease protein BmrA n=1 Tax=Streptomyces scabiei TaxID=1930 RepID=A0A100JIR1_STRSC|nr:multidrug resistance ABC transporter ATP-binding/permease protein BmrA [Streptomyces scabiei]